MYQLALLTNAQSVQKKMSVSVWLKEIFKRVNA